MSDNRVHIDNYTFVERTGKDMKISDLFFRKWVECQEYLKWTTPKPDAPSGAGDKAKGGK